MVWFVRHLKDQPLTPQAGAPSTRPNCLKPHPTWCLQHFHGRGIHNVLGQHVPVPDHTHSEDFLSNIYFKPILIVSRQLVNISSVGDSTQSLDNLFQCAVIHTESLNGSGWREPQWMGQARRDHSGWLRLEGTTVEHLVQPPCSGRVTLERMEQDCVQGVHW